MRTYPVFSGVPILTHRPEVLLQAYTRASKDDEVKIRDLEDAYLRNVNSNSLSAPYCERAHRALSGMRMNSTTLQKYMDPVSKHLRDRPMRMGLTDTISSCAAGWPAEVMMHNFFLDWGGSGDMGAFSTVRSLTKQAITQYRPDSESVAVLAAGACGLVQALASDFEIAYGIDLSVPTLLLANGVLAGDPISLQIKECGWHHVKLENQNTHGGNIHLAAADVVTLPLEPDSLSVVITQYLMDIVSNPYCVAAEIRRVLKPGGLWVNFSMPLRQPHEPTEFGLFTLHELPTFLNSAGLELAESHQQRYSIMDFQRIDKNALALLHNVHFFMALKPNLPVTGVFSRKPLSDEDYWRYAVPGYIEGRTAQIIRAISHSGKGTSYAFEASFGFSSFPFLDRFSVSEDHAAQLGDILDLIDGKRSISQIHDVLIQNGHEIGCLDLCELFDYLWARHGLVNMK